MIHLKNKKAFTLIEVLIALAIVGIMFGPIYFAQGSIFRTIVKMSNAVSRMFVAYNFFVTVEPDQKDITKEIDDPKTKITYEAKELPKESTLAQHFNHLTYEKCTWSWTVLGAADRNSFVSLHFKPPKKKEAKEPEQAKTPQQPAQTNDNKTQLGVQKNQKQPVAMPKGGRP